MLKILNCRGGEPFILFFFLISKIAIFILLKAEKKTNLLFSAAAHIEINKQPSKPFNERKISIECIKYVCWSSSSFSAATNLLL